VAIFSFNPHIFVLSKKKKYTAGAGMQPYKREPSSHILFSFLFFLLKDIND
jgi:hypothetical protein